jgi:polar amino acid transport system substrate-binding protein
MSIFRSVILAAILLLGISIHGVCTPVVPAGSTTPAVPTYTIGVENLQYYPFSIIENREYSGFSREVLDAFAKRQGFSFKYVPLAVNPLFSQYLVERTLDFKYPDNPKWKPELRSLLTISYSAPLVVSNDVAMVLPQNVGRNIKQIKTLGTVNGFTAWPYMKEIEDKSLSVVTNGSFEGLLRDAMQNRIDAVFINIDVANAKLRDVLRQPGALVFDPGLPYGRSDFCLSTLKYPGMVEEFNAFLLNERVFIESLRKKYKIEEFPEPLK